MKPSIIAAMLALFFVGCTAHQSDQLTQKQKDGIKTEVNAVMDSVVARWLRMDVQGAVQYYSPEMVAVGDSTIISYETYRKGWLDFPSTFTEVKWSTIQQETIVLSEDLAMTSAFGKLEMFMKSGDKMTIDPQIYTDVYKKFGTDWKIIYEHGSGVPVTQKGAKK